MTPSRPTPAGEPLELPIDSTHPHHHLRRRRCRALRASAAEGLTAEESKIAFRELLQKKAKASERLLENYSRS
jgi:hypothetical protein